jgi:hypothetical protein
MTLNTLYFIVYFSLPLVDGKPDDSVAIYSLLPTCKVHEGDSSHHWIGPLSIRFVHPLHRHDNFIVFNLVFSFLHFSIFKSIPLVKIHRPIKCI